MDYKVKKYSDTVFYNKYPMYGVKLLKAVTEDPIIEKDDTFEKYVVREIERTRTSTGIIKILKSTNVILLDCVEPLPRTFKVFAAKNPKNKVDPKKIKVYIDCSRVIAKYDDSLELKVDESKLLSYLVNAGIVMIYNKQFKIITNNQKMLMNITHCFAKSFTFIIDYLVKVSIQESNKTKCLYLSSMYFLNSLVGTLGETTISNIATNVAGISSREANMLDILMEQQIEKYSKEIKEKKNDPYENIKIFIYCLRETLHLNPKVITLDIIAEKWMSQFGTSTIFGLEIFPAFSAMITDAYIGAYLNRQKTIEKVCGNHMVEYGKNVLSTIDYSV